MNVRRLSAVVIAASLCFAGVASAQSLAVRKKRAEIETEFKKALDEMNTKCGTTATFEFDWASFDTEAAMEIPQYCKQVPEYVWWHFCGSGKEMEQAAVKEKVKKLVCRWDPKSPEKYKSTLKLSKDGTVTFSFFTNAYNTGDLVKEALEQQL